MQVINFISFLFDINFIFTSRNMESWNVSATLSIFQIRQIRKTQRAQLYSEISFFFAYEDCARICTQIYPVPTGKGDAVAIRTY